MANGDLFLIGRFLLGVCGDFDDFVLFDTAGGIKAEVAIDENPTAFDSPTGIVPGELWRPAAEESGERLATPSPPAAAKRMPRRTTKPAANTRRARCARLPSTWIPDYSYATPSNP